MVGGSPASGRTSPDTTEDVRGLGTTDGSTRRYVKSLWGQKIGGRPRLDGGEDDRVKEECGRGLNDADKEDETGSGSLMGQEVPQKGPREL